MTQPRRFSHAWRQATLFLSAEPMRLADNLNGFFLIRLATTVTN